MNKQPDVVPEVEENKTIDAPETKPAEEHVEPIAIVEENKEAEQVVEAEEHVAGKLSTLSPNFAV